MKETSFKNFPNFEYHKQPLHTHELNEIALTCRNLKHTNLYPCFICSQWTPYHLCFVLLYTTAIKVEVFVIF